MEIVWFDPACITCYVGYGIIAGIATFGTCMLLINTEEEEKED